ncbi:MAG: lactate racemase domain-containing protein [Candidatus Thorarchaeota archaeon]
MRLDIAYGDGFLPLDPTRYNEFQIISPKTAAGIQDIDRYVQHRVTETDMFRELIKADPSKHNVIIVLEMPQRIIHLTSILEPLVDTLQTTSLTPSNIQFLLCGSSHYQLDLDETVRYLGRFTSEGSEIYIHDPHNEKTLRYMGDEPIRSIPVHLNAKYIHSTFRITLSSVMQSIFTGTTGGLLSIAPGLCGNRTAYHLAKQLARYESSVFECNPEYLSILHSTTNFATPHLYLNLVQDVKGTIAHVAAGKVDSVAKECKDVAQNLATSGIRRRSDVAVVGAGGKGYDSTLYDATESLHAAFSATRTGGTILLVAECKDGVGPEGFLEGMTNTKTESELRVMAETNFKIGMERARFLRKVMESRDLVICSRLRESLVVEKIGCPAVRDPQEGLDMIVRSNGTNSRIVIIEQAPFVHPIVI